MLTRSLLLFAFTSLSLAIVIPPTINQGANQQLAKAACENLCNKNGCTDPNVKNCQLCVMSKLTNSGSCPGYDPTQVGAPGCGHVESPSGGKLSGTL
ncbi:hypothetical protein FKW77_004713 [Venturia effusa]|uniref:Uncharacterized protein n=1 Tax=Venturia effusa TaxID=50376 RepID=A0A517KZD8_9PEZI|nr:hypothetical protein FKW77_004713 [Venturia effusa]